MNGPEVDLTLERKDLQAENIRPIALLDTLVLAMPVSCKGTLQQYAGRLHRAMGYKIASESPPE